MIDRNGNKVEIGMNVLFERGTVTGRVTGLGTCPFGSPEVLIRACSYHGDYVYNWRAWNMNVEIIDLSGDWK